MVDRDSSETQADNPEGSLGRCPTDEVGEFAWRLEFRRRMSRMRGGYVEERPHAKVKVTGGMRAEDFFGRCPAYELDGLEQVRRELRARVRKEPKI